MDVRQAREAAGISQRELSNRTGISQATLSRIEAGDREASEGEARLIDVALAKEGLASARVERSPKPGEELEASREPRRRLESYPAAPSDPVERLAWFNRRNRLLQERGR